MLRFFSCCGTAAGFLSVQGKHRACRSIYPVMTAPSWSKPAQFFLSINIYCLHISFPVFPVVYYNRICFKREQWKKRQHWKQTAAGIYLDRSLLRQNDGSPELKAFRTPFRAKGFICQGAGKLINDDSTYCKITKEVLLWWTRSEQRCSIKEVFSWTHEMV